MTPDQFLPETASDLIGQAAELAVATLKHALRVKQRPDSNLKVLLYGPPGTGKTTLARMVAQSLASHSSEIQTFNGRELTIDAVRNLKTTQGYASVLGGWNVWLFNELDLMPLQAQDLLLQVIDDLGTHYAVIGTTNLDRDTLGERFTSRFQQILVEGPPATVVRRWLQTRWRLPAAPATVIADNCHGNVRMALNQAAAFLTFGTLPNIKPPGDRWSGLKRAAEAGNEKTP